MKKWKERWNEMLPYEKKFEVGGYVFIGLSLAVMLLQTWLLAIKGVGLPGIHILKLGLMAMLFGCLAVVSWRKQRGTAILNLILAIWWGFDAIWEIVKLFI